MTTQETYPVLYIIMRNDLDSMNPGKAMAQASHASNAFVTKIDKEDPYMTSGGNRLRRDSVLSLSWQETRSSLQRLSGRRWVRLRG